MLEVRSVRRHQGIVAFVRRAAKRILDDYHP
jgi:hypothetical protein